MFEQISFSDARTRSWDVVIAGSSFAAMFFLHGLPAASRVLVVERGTILPHADQVAGEEVFEEDYAMENTSGHEKEWTAKRTFGGNSNCWWGQVPRFHPSDFRLFEDHGVGAPWPVDYDTLEPYWREVESLMQVAGGGNDHILPRSAPFPYPNHIPSRHDVAAIAAMPDIWVPVPTARSNGGDRPVCCATGACGLCPIDAKFTIENGVSSFARPGVFLLTGGEARGVETSAGAASGLWVRAGEAEALIPAPVVALATNAINNAAILLRSGFEHPALGRYLHEQISWTLHVDVDAPGYFGGSSITGHCYGFINPQERDTRASVLIENYNNPRELRLEPGRWTERMRLKLIAEDIPLAENRVTLVDDAPHIHWTGHSDYAREGLAHAHDHLQDVLPFTIENIEFSSESKTEAHIQGTHRMGRDPTTSVTDDGQQVHGTPGLYALGAGAFPTSSASNPTLTLSALALRAGRRLA